MLSSNKRHNGGTVQRRQCNRGTLLAQATAVAAAATGLIPQEASIMNKCCCRHSKQPLENPRYFAYEEGWTPTIDSGSPSVVSSYKQCDELAINSTAQGQSIHCALRVVVAPYRVRHTIATTVRRANPQIVREPRYPQAMYERRETNKSMSRPQEGLNIDLDGLVGTLLPYLSPLRITHSRLRGGQTREKRLQNKQTTSKQQYLYQPLINNACHRTIQGRTRQTNGSSRKGSYSRGAATLVLVVATVAYVGPGQQRRRRTEA